MKYKRTHWIYIFESMYRFIPLLVLPLLRGFLAALKGSLYAWLSGTWIDIFVVLMMVALAVLRWHETEYAFDGEIFHLRGGLLRYRDCEIPISRLCTVSVESPWYYRMFGATKLRMDTQAGGNRSADVEVTLKTATALNILALTRQEVNHGGKKMERRYSPRLLSIMIISAFLSNSFAGMAFVATFISQLGTLAGRELEDRFVGTFNRIVELLSFGIPPVAAAIAYIIIGGWLIGFLMNLLRHQNFELCRDRATLLIRGGLITPRATMVRISQLNFLSVRQGLFTKLIGVYTVFGHCAGMGKKKEDLTALAPASGRRELEKNFRILFEEFPIAPLTVRPNWLALMRFLTDPLWPCVLLPLATHELIVLFPQWGELTLFVGFMACIPAYWWLAVRLVDFATSGIGADEKGVTMRYSHLLELNLVVIPWDKIVKVTFRQSLFQKPDNKCDVFVYTRAESVQKHRVRNVDIDEAKKLMRVNEHGKT